MTTIESTLTAEQRVSVLAQEIRSARAALTNAIQTRKVHPTYGITKRSILDRVAELEGLLFAYAIIVDGQTSAMRASLAADIAERHFDFDLRKLTAWAVAS